jgi:hypothetical protein
MKKFWRGEKDGVKYQAELKGIKFEYSASTGNKETSGGGSLLPRHFFKPRWQKHFKEVFSAEDFKKISLAIEKEYELFQKNPEKYKRKPYQPS